MSRIVIGIAGGTGSGKTTVATRIVEQLPPGSATLLQHDWYYRDRSHVPNEERARINFDEPAALENELLREHLLQLKQGRAVECPQYDFVSHTRSPEPRRVEPATVVIVEGILIFAVPDLSEVFDLRIFVDTDDDIRLLRRIKRDVDERGRDMASVEKQYLGSVRPMHQKHVVPSRREAHLIIPEGGENQHALDVVVGKLLHTLTVLEGTSLGGAGSRQ